MNQARIMISLEVLLMYLAFKLMREVMHQVPMYLALKRGFNQLIFTSMKVWVLLSTCIIPLYLFKLVIDFFKHLYI